MGKKKTKKRNNKLYETRNINKKEIAKSAFTFEEPIRQEEKKILEKEPVKEINSEESNKKINSKKSENKEKIAKKRKGKKASKPNPIIYILSVLIFAGMLFHGIKAYMLLSSYTFIPEKYIHYFLYGLIGAGVFFGIYGLFPVNNLNKILSSVLCVVLAFALAEATILLPSYKTKLERTFVDVPEEGEMNINLYVLNDSNYEGAQDLEGKSIGVQTSVDIEYQDYTINKLKANFTENISIKEYPDIYSLVEALLNYEVDSILLNETYAAIVEGDEQLGEFNNVCKSIYTCVQKKSYDLDIDEVENITTDPFIIMVGGNDTSDYTSILKNFGRTDVQLMCVVNPSTYQILVVTIPRDAYMPFWGDNEKMDKLTHATVYGIDCWLDTISDYMQLKVNYFIRVNFSSVINIANVLGGITIDNPYEFNSGYDAGLARNFPEGKITLDGESVLAYVRERQNLPNGDLDRNQHQSIVLKGIIDKVTSYETITNFDKLLDAVKGTFMTNLSIDQIYELVRLQIEIMPEWEILQYSISGDFTSATSYAMGVSKGPIYSVVELDKDTVNKARSYIKKMFNNQKITIE